MNERARTKCAFERTRTYAAAAAAAARCAFALLNHVAATCGIHLDTSVSQWQRSVAARVTGRPACSGGAGAGQRETFSLTL